MEIIPTINTTLTGDILGEAVENLLSKNVDYLRFNLSKYGDLTKLLNRTYEITDLMKKYPIRVMLDLPYPYKKSRIFINGFSPIIINAGETITISRKSTDRIYTDAPFCSDLSIGDSICYSDGQNIWEVMDLNEENVVVKVNDKCILHATKSINYGKPVRNKNVGEMYIDIINDISPNSIVLSFVNSVDDITEFVPGIRSDIEVISKVETYESVVNVNEIAQSSNIMIGRGDLRLYADYHLMYYFQEYAAASAKTAGKKLYVATGILPSLENNEIPTPAEIVDISKIVEYKSTGIILNGIKNIERVKNIISALMDFEGNLLSVV